MFTSFLLTYLANLSLNIEINGVWGFIPGNAITTSQVPSLWRDSYKSYFMVTRVTHEFQQSDWVTRLEGILAYYKNINYVKL